MQLPNRRFTSALPSEPSFAARSPKGRPTAKPAAKAPAKPAPAKAPAKPAAKPVAKPAAKPAPKRASKAAPKVPDRPERLALRQMGRGRRPANLPDTPALPPPPPSAPEYEGSAPTMSYGEAPVPPKKKSKSKSQGPQSTAARAAEAARAAVWSVSSPKTTAQIEAAETAFEEALVEHHAQDPVAEKPAAPVAETPVRKGPAPKDRWIFFREELERPDSADDPHRAWRLEQSRPRHEMFRPATEEQLVQVEAELKVSLPPSYRDFSLKWGGARLYTQEWREVRLVGARDITVELTDRLCGRMRSPFIPVVDLGQGDYLAFDTSKPNAKGEFPIHWWYGGSVKKKVSPTFADWLEQFVANSGEAFWWEEAE